MFDIRVTKHYSNSQCGNDYENWGMIDIFGELPTVNHYTGEIILSYIYILYIYILYIAGPALSDGHLKYF